MPFSFAIIFGHPAPSSSATGSYIRSYMNMLHAALRSGLPRNPDNI